MKVTAMKALRRGERLRLVLDDGRELTLAQEVVLRRGLARGDEIDERLLRELEEGDLFWRAREAALSLLSYRARSRHELEQRLHRKEFPASVVERCLDELAEKGLLNDEAFAESFVRDRVRGRPSGPRRLVQELRVKGVEADQAHAAISGVMESEGLSELDLARQAIARWRPRLGEEPVRARRRLYGFLARRGFTGETLRIILDEVELEPDGR